MYLVPNAGGAILALAPALKFRHYHPFCYHFNYHLRLQVLALMHARVARMGILRVCPNPPKWRHSPAKRLYRAVPYCERVGECQGESQKFCQVARSFHPPPQEIAYSPSRRPPAVRHPWDAVSFDSGRATAGRQMQVSRASPSTQEECLSLSATEEFEGCCLGSVAGSVSSAITHVLQHM